jgi:signal transduction histidine kinase
MLISYTFMESVENTNSTKGASSMQNSRELSARVLQAQDEERRRIARELHDSTGQDLALLTLNLGRLRTRAEKVAPILEKSVSDCFDLAKHISAELRTISYLLHPPLLDELGLASALLWYIDGFKHLTNIDVELGLSKNLQRLPSEIEIAIFRIVQESLTNVHRHSGSSKASISLERKARDVVLEVSDEGKGIPAQLLSRLELGSSTGVGLRGMRERVKSLGGEIQIGRAAKGTRIKAVIPIAVNDLANCYPT